MLLWHDGVEATVYFTTGQTLCNAFASITLGNDTGSSHAWPPALFLDGTAGSTLLHVDNMVLLSGAITVLPSPTNQPVGLVVTRTLSASSVHTPSVAPFVGGLPSTSMALTVSAATLTISGHLGSLGSFSMASTNVSVSTLLLTNYASWSLSTMCVCGVSRVFFLSLTPCFSCEVHAPVLHACPDCTVHLFGPTQFYVQSWTGGLLFGAAGSSVGFHGPVTMDNVTIYGDLTAFSTFLVVISDSVLVTGKLSATNTFFVQGQGAPRNRAMFNVTEGGLLYLHSAMVLSSPGQVLYAGPGAHVGMGRSTHVQLYAGTMVLDRVSEWYFDDKASLLLQEGTNLTLVSVPRLHWYVSPSLLLSPRITVGGNANIWLSGYGAGGCDGTSRSAASTWQLRRDHLAGVRCFAVAGGRAIHSCRGSFGGQAQLFCANHALDNVVAATPLVRSHRGDYGAFAALLWRSHPMLLAARRHSVAGGLLHPPRQRAARGSHTVGCRVNQ